MLNIFFRYLGYFLLLGGAISLDSKPIDLTALSFRQSRLTRVENGIRIFLSDIDRETDLRVEGGYGIYNPATQRRITGGLLSKSYQLSGNQEGLCWGEIFPDLYQMTIVPEGQDGGFYLQDRFFPGILHVYLVEGELKLINQISLDDYSSVVCCNAQRESAKQVETLASLAICARTQALSYIKLRQSCYWHAEAKRSGYCGITNRPAFERELKAQIKTRDLILATKDRHYLIPEWTDHCAGHTVDYNLMHARDAIFSQGQIQGVFSPWAHRDRERSKWVWALTESELARSLNLKTPLQIELDIDKKSGKVTELTVGDGAQKKQLTFFHLQKIFGREFKSSEFSQVKDQITNNITFTGYGEGAGVGLCLYSAEKMAKEGKTAKEILRFFFPEFQLYLQEPEHCDINFNKMSK